MYKIFGSESFQPFSPVGTDLFKMGRRQSRYFFELGRKVMHAAVAKLVGNLREALVIVNDQFLGPFDSQRDKIILDRRALDGGKQVAEVGVFVVQLPGNEG